MSAHHTAGDWVAGKQIIEDETNVPYVSIRAGQKLIAMVTYGMPDEMFANARALAASPDLLASLAKLVTWADTYARASGIDIHADDGPLASDIYEARRVLARAKGQP